MCSKSVAIGSLSVSDNSINDPMIADHETECLICNDPTDHVSGVCDGCSQEDTFDVFDGDYDPAYDEAA